MQLADKLELIYDRLYHQFGDCRCPLEHKTPFQLLAAVMLSAQCRDERVNQVTKTLFAVAPDPPGMVALGAEKVADIIRPCGLFESKSRNLVSCARQLLEEFGGEVPQTLEELIQLPGIGRKSANVILGNAFDIPGFPVDTHVNRVLNRLGVVSSPHPEDIEKQVCAKIAPRYWTNFSHLIINHGRRTCSARKPDCGNCVLADICAEFSAVKGKNGI